MQYTLLRLKAHSLFKKKKKKSHDEKKVRTTTTKKNRTKGSELGGVSFGVTRLAVTFLAQGFGILKVASGRVGSLSLFPQLPNTVTRRASPEHVTVFGSYA